MNKIEVKKEDQTKTKTKKKVQTKTKKKVQTKTKVKMTELMEKIEARMSFPGNVRFLSSLQIEGLGGKRILDGASKGIIRQYKVEIDHYDQKNGQLRANVQGKKVVGILDLEKMKDKRFLFSTLSKDDQVKALVNLLRWTAGRYIYGGQIKFWPWGIGAKKKNASFYKSKMLSESRAFCPIG